MALTMKVTLSAASALTNAYRSVRSAYGSPAIMGASRWLEAPTNGVPRRPTSNPAVAAKLPISAIGRFTLTPPHVLDVEDSGAIGRACWPSRATHNWARPLSYSPGPLGVYVGHSGTDHCVCRCSLLKKLDSVCEA